MSLHCSLTLYCTTDLELLAFPDPDLNLGDVSEAGSAQQGHLLHLGQRVGVLGVDLLVVHSLCRTHRVVN